MPPHLIEQTPTHPAINSNAIEYFPYEGLIEEDDIFEGWDSLEEESPLLKNPHTQTAPTQEKQEEPRSIPFNRHLWSDHPEVNECARRIVDTHCVGYTANTNRNKLLGTAKVIFLNLYQAHQAGDEYWVSFSRNKTRIDIPVRYRKSGLNHSHLKLITDTLHRRELIEMKKGYFDRSEYGNTKFSKSKQSIMRAVYLRPMFDSIKPEYITRHNRQVLVELKSAPDEKDWRRLIDYKSTVDILRIKRDLIAYNELLKESEIKLTVAPRVFLDLSDITVKRVFNNGVWTQGGRFYGGWWLGTPSNARHAITINGNPTIELDYKALHPVILYQGEGVTLNYDPYILPQYGNHPERAKIRKLSKDMLLIWLNASSENEAMGRLRQDIAEDREKANRRYPENIPNLKDMANGLKALNEPIVQHFFKGLGVHLQFKDSCIAEKIIRAFTREGRVVLCLHDGFRCEQVYKGYLNELMANSYMSVMRSTSYPTIEVK